MILPGDQPRAQTPLERWIDRQLKRAPIQTPPASLPVPPAPPRQNGQKPGQGLNPGTSGARSVYSPGAFCLGADRAICEGVPEKVATPLGDLPARDACRATSNLVCLMAGVLVLLVLAALAFVPQRRPGVGLAIVLVLILGWAWRTGRLPLAAQAAKGM